VGCLYDFAKQKKFPTTGSRFQKLVGVPFIMCNYGLSISQFGIFFSLGIAPWGKEWENWYLEERVMSSVSSL